MIPFLERRYRDRRTGRLGSLLDLDDGRDLDPVGIATLLAYGGLVGHRSLLQDVESAAAPLELAIPEISPATLSRSDRVDRLWELLCGAVEAAVEGRSSVRCALSGGLDSRAVAAAAVHVGAPGLSFGTFGDPDCPDLPAARAVSAAFGRPHRVDELAPGDALLHEERVWLATDGVGGPASSPGAPTDAPWSEGCDVLLSGCSADVIWGDTAAPGPSPAGRLRKLGVVASPDTPAPPPAPSWAGAGGQAAWFGLHGRQRAVTWSGVLPRLAYTPVEPVVWHPPLMSWALALPMEDRRGRSLLIELLERHAPTVAPSRLPAVKTAGVHSLDRAWRTSPEWQEELRRWASDDPREVAAFRVIGIRRRPAIRMIRQALSRRRDRADFLSRLRALRRWGLRRA